MKKIFPLTHKKKHPDRIIEAIKNELRKYVKRERKKKLPEGSDFWDLKCQFGKSKESAEKFAFAQMIKEIDIAKEEEWSECYIEIVTKAEKKVNKEVDNCE